MLGKDGGRARRLMRKPMVHLCFDCWIKCCFSHLSICDEHLEKVKQVDIGYGTISILGIKQKSKGNIIEMYKYGAVEREQLCNLPLVQVLEATCEITRK